MYCVIVYTIDQFIVSLCIPSISLLSMQYVALIYLAIAVTEHEVHTQFSGLFISSFSVVKVTEEIPKIDSIVMGISILRHSSAVTKVEFSSSVYCIVPQ